MKQSLYCGEPAISLHSHHVSLVQWANPMLPVTRDLGSNPLGGYLCDIGIYLLALSCYIGDPDEASFYNAQRNCRVGEMKHNIAISPSMQKNVRKN